MKTKTLIVKSEEGKKAIDFKSFFDDYYKVYHFNSSLIKEVDGYYWHILVVYEAKATSTKGDISLSKEKYGLYDTEILELIDSQRGIVSTRALNVVTFNREKIWKMKTIRELGNLSNLGEKMLTDYKDFYETVLAIAKKYQE